MNNPSEAYYQLRYDFTLHYLFVVYENLLLLLDFDICHMIEKIFPMHVLHHNVKTYFGNTFFSNVCF